MGRGMPRRMCRSGEGRLAVPRRAYHLRDGDATWRATSYCEGSSSAMLLSYLMKASWYGTARVRVRGRESMIDVGRGRESNENRSNTHNDPVTPRIPVAVRESLGQDVPCTCYSPPHPIRKPLFGRATTPSQVLNRHLARREPHQRRSNNSQRGRNFVCK